jgi:hypothetical protein
MTDKRDTIVPGTWSRNSAEVLVVVAAGAAEEEEVLATETEEELEVT